MRFMAPSLRSASPPYRRFLVGFQTWLQAGGGAFLFVLGLKTAFARPTAARGKSGGAKGGLAGAYLSTLLLTLTNPATLLAFVAIFAGLGLGGTMGGALGAGLTVAGVFLGSSLWWLLLSFLAGMLRHRLHAAALRDVHIVSGTCIAGLGLWQLGVLARSLLL
jgi:threonine/homoserine/homoserine lactone efflux protein